MNISKNKVEQLTGPFIGYVEDFINFTIPNNQDIRKMKAEYDSAFDDMLKLEKEIDENFWDIGEEEMKEKDQELFKKEKQAIDKQLIIRKQLCEYCIDFFMNDQGYDVSNNDIKFLMNYWFKYFELD